MTSGLKRRNHVFKRMSWMSRPARGAWIETLAALLPQVALWSRPVFFL